MYEENVYLMEYDINKIAFTPTEEYSGLDFLSDEQQHVFWLADFVYTSFDIEQSEFFRASQISHTANIDNTTFYKTGFTYESVLNAFSSVLSEDIVTELIDQKCANINNEFVCADGARGINASFMFKLEFEPVDIGDNIVKFKALAGYGDPSGTEITSHKEFNFEMTKTDEKWVVTKFEMWK